jgi:predicted amidohydrolase YtcJ
LQLTNKARRAESSPPLSIHLKKSETETAVPAELILHNAKIATNGMPSFVEAIAITAGSRVATGKDEEILRLRGLQTRVIDGRRRTVIPGLNDSHMHPIRGGLNYNLELRLWGLGCDCFAF